MVAEELNTPRQPESLATPHSLATFTGVKYAEFKHLRPLKLLHRVAKQKISSYLSNLLQCGKLSVHANGVRFFLRFFYQLGSLNSSRW
ncbi:predicted protein [Plenodomus lingam JN3]|uniref:Predicted protein n=1 Tax=Leptosphaeria maculans (strain JN3 / isolate v23.1.3 / race Av1-4-5-6-7-8) TaxID=985895 RepID=E5A992_LEPMJ|nr:predicted protein [Plenodomus lingam JN3]CBY00233.1 predicted protein [Plenodomus lingam JN3]